MVPSTLTGRRIVITRPEPDAGRLAERLRALGATPVVVPAIRIEFTDPPELDAALKRIAGYDWVIFTSRNGVEAVFRRTRSIAGPRVAAIGPATAQALRERGVEPDLMPTEYVAEAVLDALGDVAGRRCLLPRADIAREALTVGLTARGALVDEIAAYRTRPLAEQHADLGAVDAVTFTSSSTVRGFLAGGPVPEGARIVCIGPITADTARACGLSVSAVAQEYTEDGLIAALQEAFTRP
jgi:uroporphyrinogen III methyltransferase/synthase